VSDTREIDMSQHPDHYTAGESAKRAVLLVRGLRAAASGRSTASADRALDRLAEKALERETAEAAAREKARQDAVRQRADAKAARTR
jgi:hypothetical protein